MKCLQTDGQTDDRLQAFSSGELNLQCFKKKIQDSPYFTLFRSKNSYEIFSLHVKVAGNRKYDVRSGWKSEKSNILSFCFKSRCCVEFLMDEKFGC